MVSRFANAGNIGANIWGWAEKIVTLDLNKKASDWENAVDAVLASYTNRMNLACGENMQLNLAAHETAGSNVALQNTTSSRRRSVSPRGCREQVPPPLEKNSHREV